MSFKHLVLIITVCFSASMARAESAKLIGYSALSQKVFQRIFEPQQDLSLIDLFYFEESPESFKDFLGVYESSPESDKIKNGDPNAFNFILLGLLADSIAATVADACNGESISIFSSDHRKQYVLPLPELTAPVHFVAGKVCRWPLESQEAEQVMTDLYDQIAMFDFPQSEYEAWMSHFSQPHYQTQSGQDMLYDMVYSLFMNPYFLLKQ